MKSFLLYFGCWDRPGHFLFDRNKRTVYDPEQEYGPRVFSDKALDGSFVFLPRPEEPGVGRLTHVLVGDDCTTVLAWWDRTFDTRGNCNAAIQLSGWENADVVWERFQIVYPALGKVLKKPRLVV